MRHRNPSSSVGYGPCLWLLVFGGADVFQDEHLFARPDQAEFAPGHLFDSTGVVTQAPRLIGQSRVFRALVGDDAGKFMVAARRARSVAINPRSPTIASSTDHADDNQDDPAPTVRPGELGLRGTSSS